MADDVVVNDEAISKLATKFSTWAGDLQKTIDSLNPINIEAGDFTDATELRTLVTTRQKALVKNLTNIHKTLTGISDDLAGVAQDYRTSEHDNQITAKELDNLSKDAGNNLPGLNKK